MASLCALPPLAPPPPPAVLFGALGPEVIRRSRLGTGFLPVTFTRVESPTRGKTESKCLKQPTGNHIQPGLPHTRTCQNAFIIVLLKRLQILQNTQPGPATKGPVLGRGGRWLSVKA